MGSDLEGIGSPMGTPSQQADGTQAALTEALRKSYKPERVIVLLVGEAPPSNGTFFYKCNSNLFKYTTEAFAAAYGLQFQSDTDFLAFFKGRGFFLDDLRLQPIDIADRARQRQAAVGYLAIRIQDYHPKYVIAVMKGIEPYVREAASLAAIQPTVIRAVDFPTRGHHSDFARGLTAILRELIAAGAV